MARSVTVGPRLAAIAALLAAAALLTGLPEFGVPGGTLVLVALLACAYVRVVEGGLASIGFQLPATRRDVVIGVAAALVFYAAAKLVVGPVIESAFGVQRDLSRFDALRGNAALAAKLFVGIWLTAAFAEEVLFRGFLWAQLRKLLGDGRGAQAAFVALSAALFGAVHSYQGVAGVLQTGFFGGAFAVLFLACGRRLWANVLAHGLFDSISLLLIFTNADRAIDRFMS